MSKKRKQPTPELSGPIRWEFDPNIPTHDFFETFDVEDNFAVDEAVENFVFEMENGQFLAWEAVVCHEQGLPLSRQQKVALRDLIDSLQPCKDTVAYFDLTLDSLLTREILPDRDKPIFVQMMQAKLGLKSTTDRIAGYLRQDGMRSPLRKKKQRHDESQVHPTR